MTVRPRRAQALPYLLAFVLGLGTAGLAACGGKENPAMLPAANASELKGHLDDVLAAIESEECGDTRRALAQVRADLESLPSRTSERLQARLREAVSELDDQAAKECVGTTATETTTTETAPPVTTETVPTVTTTTVPTTPPETTPTTTPTTPTTTPTTPQQPTPTTPADDTGGLETP